MVDSGNEPIAVEPITKEEEKQREKVPYHVEKDTNFPAEWINKDIPAKVQKGFKYYKHSKPDGKTYMSLRLGKKSIGLGAYDEEREGKLFHFFPDLETMGGIVPAVWHPDASSITTTPHGGRAGAQHSYLGMDIKRLAVIPREYVPSLNVVRYYQIMRENGFPGDFSMFINDVVDAHFRKCNGIKLPVMLEEEMNIVREEDENVESTTSTAGR